MSALSTTIAVVALVVSVGAIAATIERRGIWITWLRLVGAPAAAAVHLLLALAMFDARPTPLGFVAALAGGTAAGSALGWAARLEPTPLGVAALTLPIPETVWMFSALTVQTAAITGSSEATRVGVHLLVGAAVLLAARNTLLAARSRDVEPSTLRSVHCRECGVALDPTGSMTHTCPPSEPSSVSPNPMFTAASGPVEPGVSETVDSIDPQ